MFGQNLRASMMKGMDLSPQGGRELVKVMQTPSSIVTGHQEIHFLSLFFSLSIIVVNSN